MERANEKGKTKEEDLKEEEVKERARQRMAM